MAAESSHTAVFSCLFWDVGTGCPCLYADQASASPSDCGCFPPTPCPPPDPGTAETPSQTRAMRSPVHAGAGPCPFTLGSARAKPDLPRKAPWASCSPLSSTSVSHPPAPHLTHSPCWRPRARQETTLPGCGGLPCCRPGPGRSLSTGTALVVTLSSRGHFRFPREETKAQRDQGPVCGCHM